MKIFKQILIVASMGLGLGIGVTISTLSGLQVVRANRPTAQQPAYSVAVTKVTINDRHIYSVSRDKQQHADLYEETKQGLGRGRTTILHGSGTALMSQLKEVRIGTELRVLGSNNGYYTYTVTEIVSVPRDHSTQLVSDTDEQLIISVYAHPWDTTETAFIASYHQ